MTSDVNKTLRSFQKIYAFSEYLNFTKSSFRFVPSVKVAKVVKKLYCKEKLENNWFVGWYDWLKEYNLTIGDIEKGEVGNT